MKALIVVTHLLGTGHLARALTLARAFADAGHEVTLISGGMPVPHFDTGDLHFVQLPPLRSDGVDFSQLLDEHGKRATDNVFVARTAALTSHARNLRPDVVITELFPFGRRILTDEFRALLRTCQQMSRRPFICASIRDILAPPSKPAKAALAQSIIDAFYDAVLVHSDPDITPLDASWPVDATLAEKLHYTGYITAEAEGSDTTVSKGEILVSTGGGNVASGVYTAAVEAAAQAPELTWRLFVAGQDPDDQIAALQTKATPNVTVQPATPAFRNMLATSAASVSLCGYNTALDILQSGTPAVFVPFDDGGEVEQGLRADTLAALDGIEIVTSSELSAEVLLKKLRLVMAAPKRARMTHNIRGAARSVEIMESLLDETA